MRQYGQFFFVIFLLVSSFGLATPDRPPIPPEELLTASALGLGPDPLAVASDEVLALSDEMREFLGAHVKAGAGDEFKLNQLIHAIINRASFGLEYDEITRTAAETFNAKRGNCLSFTYMFVALARGAGIEARFQEVDIPPAWTFTYETYVLNRHINIYVDLGVTGQVVDFNIGDFKSDYDTRIISDERALAHFFNNLGAERLQRGEMTAAFHALSTAIAEHDRRFSPAWANLGTWYVRKGLDHRAEAAYLQALEINKSEIIAMSNLTALYDLRGDPELAERYRNKVRIHRRQNPYYRYQLGRLAFYSEDYDRAIGHLKYAARKDRDEDRFCAMLGVVYLQVGDEKKAQKWMVRAEKLSETDSLQRLYSSKIDRLRSATR